MKIHKLDRHPPGPLERVFGPTDVAGRTVEVKQPLYSGDMFVVVDEEWYKVPFNEILRDSLALIFAQEKPVFTPEDIEFLRKHKVGIGE